MRIVLSKIPEIDPGDLISQYPFTDQKGGSRRIDFMIINEKKGYKLPIELDGLTKFLGSDERPDYSRFIDFLRRQNALVNTFGIVLRYTNKEMIQNTAFIISEIRNTLLSQSRGEIQHRTEVEERKLIENTYREEIEKLRLQQNKEVKNLEQEINGLKGKIERQVETESQLTSKLRIYEDRIKHLQQNPITTANSVDIEALFVELRMCS